MTESTDERRRRMRALLDDFLERPLAEVAGPLLSAEMTDPDAITPGTLIGPYRVIREIGRGGMGVVCLAEATNETQGEARPAVALKVIRPELDAAATLERFRQERQILASLDHPGIARLIDEGITDDGRPWFAMEYVDGIPIDAFVAMHRPAIAARLELFADVCDAVEHAHARSIVHRDIKPSNILVITTGTPILIDFGIGKPLARASIRAILTRSGDGRVTRGYASPEQLRGGAVSPASDVYALGVLLYVLLTGRHPFARPSHGVRGLLHLLRPPRLGAEFPRELDAVIARSLRRTPRRRYATAGELGAAVRAVRSQRR